MQSESYEAWVQGHSELFDLPVDQAEVVLTWKTALNASVDELDSASAYLFANPSLLIGGLIAHLCCLRARIQDRRAIEYRKREESPDRGTCTLCNGSGWVTVPHPQGVRDGEWVAIAMANRSTFYTAAVFCKCPLGKWKQGRVTKPDFAGMGLEQYEYKNPHWQVQMTSRKEELHAVRVQEELLNPDSVDFNKILRDIKKRQLTKGL